LRQAPENLELEFFRKLAPTYRRDFVVWIHTAEQSETRERRIRESIALLAAGKKLGLKWNGRKGLRRGTVLGRFADALALGHLANFRVTRQSGILTSAATSAKVGL